MLHYAYAIEKRVMGNTANAALISKRMVIFIILHMVYPSNRFIALSVFQITISITGIRIYLFIGISISNFSISIIAFPSQKNEMPSAVCGV